MFIQRLVGHVSDLAKDARLNLSSMTSDESSGEQARCGLYLICTVTVRSYRVISVLEALAAEKLTSTVVTAAGCVTRRSCRTRTSHQIDQMAVRCAAVIQSVAVHDRDRQYRNAIAE